MSNTHSWLSIAKSSSVLAAGVFIFASAQAQSPQTAAQSSPRSGVAVGECSCSNPVSVALSRNSGKTQGNPADAPANFHINQMDYNDKRVNLHFGDTLSWSPPPRDLTCEFTQGIVTWTVKNNAGDGLENNDTTGLWFNSKPLVSHKISAKGPLGKGMTRTYTYSMTSADIRNGRITLLTQDDTAVIDFKVRISGCCIRPN